MKTLILSAAATLALSGAALAQVSDAEAHFAKDFVGNEAKIYDGVDGGVTETALELHAALYAEDEDNNGGLDMTPSDLRISTRGVVNETAAEIFARIDAE